MSCEELTKCPNREMQVSAMYRLKKHKNVCIVKCSTI